MLRVFLQAVLPFLAPFLLFAIYRLLVTRGRGFLGQTPWFLLTAVGLALACASFVSLAFLGGDAPGGVYVPPRIEDGRIVPGEVKPP
jgi:hypothetical protein